MLTDQTTQSEAIIACTPDAIPADKRERWMEIGMQVYAAVEEVRELPDGYACRLPSDADMLLKAAEYVSLDRLCCAFVRWALVIEPNDGPLWLHITGAEGTKELMRNTFETTTMLDERVAEAAGFTTSSRAAWVYPADPTLSTATYDVN
jgi:hypothetical protein